MLAPPHIPIIQHKEGKLMIEERHTRQVIVTNADERTQIGSQVHTQVDSNELANGIISMWNIDSQGRPVSWHIPHEMQQISQTHHAVQLIQIPDDTQPIHIIADNNGVDLELTQVFSYDTLTKTPHGFYVHYGNGIIQFNRALAEQGITEVMMSYYGKGVMLISDSRIFHNKAGSVVDTLDNILNRAEDGLKLVEQAGGLAQVMDEIEDKIDRGKEVIVNIQDAMDSAQMFGCMVDFTKQSFVLKGKDGVVTPKEMATVYSKLFAYKAGEPMVGVKVIIEDANDFILNPDGTKTPRVFQDNCTIKINEYGELTLLSIKDATLGKANARIRLDIPKSQFFIQGATETDVVSIYKEFEFAIMFDGEDLYDMKLDTPLFSFSANHEGHVYEEQSVLINVTTTKANLETTIDNLNIAVPSSMDFTVNKISNNRFRLTIPVGGRLPRNGEINVTATTNGTQLTRLFVFTRVDGGAPAKSLFLTGEQVFRYENFECIGYPDKETLVLKAVPQNYTGAVNVDWSYIDSSGVQRSMAGMSTVTIDGLTCTIKCWNYSELEGGQSRDTVWEDRKVVTIRCTDVKGEAYDDISIYKIGTGADGKDSFHVILSNETTTCTVDNTMTPIDNLNKIYTDIMCYLGGERIDVTSLDSKVKIENYVFHECAIRTGQATISPEGNYRITLSDIIEEPEEPSANPHGLHLTLVDADGSEHCLELENGDHVEEEDQTGVSHIIPTNDTSWVEFDVVYDNTIRIKKQFTISKAIQGSDGAQGDKGDSLYINVVGGTRSITYTQINTTPRPSRSAPFSAVLYNNGQPVNANQVSFKWRANGHMQGDGFGESFTPIISPVFNEAVTNNEVIVECTYIGQVMVNGALQEYRQTLHYYVPVAVTKDANGLDWVNEWNGLRTEINDHTVFTPKIFAGTKDTQGRITGVAMGCDFLNDTESKGLAGYQNDEVSFLLNTDGSLMVGNPFKNAGIGLYYSNGKFVLRVNELMIEGVEVPNANDVNNAISGAVQTVKDEFNKEINDVKTAIGDLEAEIGEGLKDSILTSTEKAKIEGAMIAIKIEYDEVCAEVEKLLQDAGLTNVVLKAELQNAYTNYKNLYSTLNTAVYNILAVTGVMPPQLIADFEKALTAFNESSRVLNSTIDSVLMDINKKYTDSIISTAKAEIEREVTEVQNAVTDLNDYVDTDFKSGMISVTKSRIIRERVDLINEELKDVKAQYEVMVADANLSTPKKTQLAELFGQVEYQNTTLQAKINTALIDYVFTDVEIEEIKAIITTYGEALQNYNAYAQQCNADIALNLAQGAVQAISDEEIFNKMTNHGTKQGMFINTNGKLYVNAQWLETRNFKVISDAGETTFFINSKKEVEITASKFTLTSGAVTNVPTKDEVTSEINTSIDANLGYTVVLDNENQSIPTTELRYPMEDKGYRVSIEVFKGATLVPFTIGAVASNYGFNVTVNNDHVVFAVRKNQQLTAYSGSFDIPITAGGRTYTKSFTWSVSAQGATTEAKVCDIVSTGQLFLAKDGVNYAPDTITLTPVLQGVSFSKWQYRNAEGSLVDVNHNTNGVTLSGQILTISKNSTLLNNSTVVFKLATSDANIYDTFTIAKVRSGIDGIDGISGVDGKDGVSSYFHIKYSDDGKTFTANGGETVGKWMGTYSDSKPVDSTVFSDYNWVKIVGEDGKNGQDGESAKYVLLNGEQVFRYSNNFTGTPTPSSITLSATPYNINTPTFAWSYKRAGETTWHTITEPTTANARTYTLNHNNSTIFNTSDVKSVTIRCTVDGIYDELTIVKISDGTNGQDGADGLSVTEIKEKYYLSTSQQTLIGGSWVDVAPTWTKDKFMWTKTVFVYSNGSTKETTPICVTGKDGADGLNGGVSVYDVDTFYYQSDSPTALIGGYWDTNAPQWINGKYIWSKTITYLDNNTQVESNPICISGEKGQDGRDGVDGVTGADGVSTYFYVRYSANSNGNPMTTTPQADSKYMGVCSTIATTPPTDFLAYTWTLIKGADGQNGQAGANGADGRTSYLHIKYSNDGGKTFTGNGGEDLGTWIGTYVDFTSTDSSNVSAYSWSKFVGDDGTDAKQVIVNGEQVFKYSNNFTGNPVNTSIILNATLIGVSGAQWSYRAVGSTTTTNISGANTASLTVAHNASYWGNNKVLVFRCTSGGVYDEITISKISDGSNGANGQDGQDGQDGADAYTVFLTNENHTFPAQSTGAITSNTSIVTKVVAYKGLTKVTPSISTTPTVTGLTISKGVVANNELPITITALAGSSLAYSGTFDLVITVDGKTFTKTFSWSKSLQGAQGANGVNGQDGQDGKGVASITEEYYLSTSMTSLVGGTWSPTVPTASRGKYIWTRSVIRYTDNTSTTTTPVCVSGADGTNGTNGTNGQDGVSITKVDVEYAQSTSSTTAPTTGWSTTAPTWASGKYIWERTKVYYSSGTTTTTQPACITGQKGETGATGANGVNGKDAKTCDITANTQIFKSTDGGLTFTPNTITLTPRFQAVTYSKWQYSTDGSTWKDVVNGSNSITVSGGILTIGKACNLFTSAITSISFKVVTSDSAVFDTITISKLYDVTDITIGTVNYIRDSKFELGYAWSSYNGGAYRVEEGRNGGWCARVTGALATTRNVYQTIKDGLEKNTQYTLTMWTKGDNIVAGTTNYVTAVIISYYLNGTWKAETRPITIPTGTSDWTKRSLTFTTPTVDWDNVELYLYNRDFTGTTWWDDIKLEKGNKASEWTASPYDEDYKRQQLQNNIDSVIDDMEAFNNLDKWLVINNEQDTYFPYDENLSTTGGLNPIGDASLVDNGKFGRCMSVEQGVENLMGGTSTWAVKGSQQYFSVDKETDEEVIVKFTVPSGLTDTSTAYWGKDVTVVTNRKYTMSCWMYVSEDWDSVIQPKFQPEKAGGSAKSYDLTKKGTWQFVSSTWTPTATTARILAYPIWSSTSGGRPTKGYVLYKNVQFTRTAFTHQFQNGVKPANNVSYEVSQPDVSTMMAYKKPLSANEFKHQALVKNGSTFTMYENGASTTAYINKWGVWEIQGIDTPSTQGQDITRYTQPIGYSLTGDFDRIVQNWNSKPTGLVYRTFLYLSKAKTITHYYRFDNSGACYLNGEKVSSGGYTTDGTLTTFNLVKGWNCIEICNVDNDTGGSVSLITSTAGCQPKFSDKITHPEILYMTAELPIEMANNKVHWLPRANCKVDEAVILNKTLTSQEVYTYFSAGKRLNDPAKIVKTPAPTNVMVSFS